MFEDATDVGESFSPTGRRSHPYLVRARLAVRKASLLIPALTPPNPHADAKGASLFVQDSSRAFLSRPRTMHDEIRTGPPYGHALSIPHCREARIKTTLSFQNLEAALPPGIPAGRRSSSRSSVLYMPELATIGSIPAANGRSAWRDREIWMQSEPCLPRIIHGDTPPKAKQREECPHTRLSGEEGAKYRDSFMRTGRTCMWTRSLFFPGFL